MTDLITMTRDINAQIDAPEAQQALLSTVFKGFQPAVMKQAITEGVIRGFNFKDFLEKNVYAIPYGNGYSLVTSIDYARKVGMRSGICGSNESVYEEKDGKILSCSVTVKRQVGGIVGEFTSKVYFTEYTTGKNLWASKPRTMIAKVAEMHALRKACPEEMAQMYAEEEMVKEATIVKETPKIDAQSFQKKLELVQTLDELKTVWSSLPVQVKKNLTTLKDEMKAKLENAEKPAEVQPAVEIESTQVLSEEEMSEIE